MADWRRVEVRLWTDDKLGPMGPIAKLLWLYLLTGPQSNRIGLYYLSPTRAARDMCVKPAQVLEAIDTLVASGLVQWDKDQEVILIVRWWKCNPPSSWKHAQGMATDLAMVPACTPLKNSWRAQLISAGLPTKMLQKLVGEEISCAAQLNIDVQDPALKTESTQPGELTANNGDEHTLCHRVPDTLCRQTGALDIDIDIDIGGGGAGTLPATSQPPSASEGKPPAQKPPPPEALRFDYDALRWNRKPTKAEGAKWREAYPGIDVVTEFHRATRWLEINNKRRKKRFDTFLMRWFSKAQDRVDGRT